MLFPLSYGRNVEERRLGRLAGTVRGVSEGIRTLDLQGHNLAP